MPREVSEQLQLASGISSQPVYVVGGWLRDLLLKRSSRDIDLAVRGAESFARRLARRLPGRLVALDEDTQVFRVLAADGAQLDVAEIQGPTIQDDLRRRDFTANAMALPLPRAALRGLSSKDLLDPCGGRKDIRKKLLRANSETVFRDDPLRLLRAFRLRAQLGFVVSPGTLAWVRKHGPLISRSARERVREELLGLLRAPQAGRALAEMDRAGLLTQVLPDLEPMRSCAAVYYGRGGVLSHSLRTVERLEFLLASAPRVFPDLAATLKADPGLLKLAALLHDIAKPATARPIQGRLRFFGHDRMGARMAGRILKGLRFSRQEESTVAAVVRSHLRPGNLAANPVVSDKAVFRFFKEVGPAAFELLAVCWADHASYLSERDLRAVAPLASRDPHTFDFSGTNPRPEVRKTLRHLQVVSFLLSRYLSHPERVRPPPLVTGHDVMRSTGLPPGPKVGEILRAIEEKQAEGKIGSREDALRFLQNL